MLEASITSWLVVPRQRTPPSILPVPACCAIPAAWLYIFLVLSAAPPRRYAINYAMEALPPFYWFDTAAGAKDKERVDASWVCGLPRVMGYFGFDRKARAPTRPRVWLRWSP